MIDKTHQLSVRQQSQLIQINRSTLYYKPKEISSTDLSLMRLIDEIHLDYPFRGRLREGAESYAKALASDILR